MADKRKRIYYTKGQITNGLDTKGGEWMFTDKTEYIGQYHKYTTNEVFSEASFVKDVSRVLIPYIDFEDLNSQFSEIGINIITSSEYDAVKTITVTPSKFSNPDTQKPTNADIKAGYMLRYFAYKVNDGNITELNKDDYDKLGSKDGLDIYLWKPFSIRWKISGPDYDIIDSMGNIKEVGIIDTNKRTIDITSETYPTLNRYITDYQAIIV
jgi:hypothetical protein